MLHMLNLFLNWFDFNQMKRVMQADAAMSEDVVPYNIIPLDAPSITNVITSFSEVPLVTLLIFFCFFFGPYLHCDPIFRLELPRHRLSTIGAYPSFLMIFLFRLLGDLICLIYCNMCLDFRFVSFFVIFGIGL